MTIVAVATFSDATILIADSRATWVGGTSEVYEDRLQKILKVGNRAVMAFAGPVDVAADVCTHLNRAIAKRPRLDSLRLLRSEMPRIARHYYGQWQARTKSKWPLSLILTGDSGREVPQVWHLQSPRFAPAEICDFRVVGSGSGASQYLAGAYDGLESVSDLKERCDRMRTGIAEALQTLNEDTVGGMFQTLILTSEGMRTVTYGYTDLDPYERPRAREMATDNGRWIQRDLVTGVELPLDHPSTLVSVNAGSLRFEDYQPPTPKELRWHLSHFLTCLRVTIDAGTIDFQEVLSAVGSLRFPVVVPLKAAVAFWGPAGKRRLSFRLIGDNDEEVVLEREIEIEVFPEIFETVEELSLPVSGPGLRFLECWVDDYRLARRAFLFDQIASRPASPEEAQEIMAALTTKQRAAEDPEIVGSGQPEVVYHTVCRGSLSEQMRLRFDRQVVAVYWREYPANIPAHVASGLRLMPGEHTVQTVLVNAQTGDESTVAESTFVSSSSCIVTPIEGDVLIPVQSRGLYYLNLVVDGSLCASTLVAFETDEPKFLYSLHDEAIEQIRSGELLFLQRRSKTGLMGNTDKSLSEGEVRG